MGHSEIFNSNLTGGPEFVLLIVLISDELQT